MKQYINAVENLVNNVWTFDSEAERKETRKILLRAVLHINMRGFVKVSDPDEICQLIAVGLRYYAEFDLATMREGDYIFTF